MHAYLLRAAACALIVASSAAVAQSVATQPGSVPARGGVMPAEDVPADAVPVITNDPLAQRGRGDAAPSVRNVLPESPLAQPGTRAPTSQAPMPLQPAAPAEVPLATEFQRFVFAASGQRLALFGYSYFAEGSRSFAPVDRLPAPGDYVVGPGDELNVRGWGSVDIDYRAVVDRNGLINIPRIGSVRVAGVRADEIEDLLRTRVARVFRNFSLNVTLGQLRSVQVFVVGQAAAPGTYTVSSLSTLINVVFASGGPSPNGSLRRVQLKRDNRVLTEIDVYDFIVRGARDGDVVVAPGDVVVFLPAGPRVALLGAIDAPAIYELKPGGESIGQVLGFGGGPRAATNQRVAQLERVDPSQPLEPRTVSRLEFPLANDLPLRDGDLLRLFAAEPRFANAVTLRGNVARPLRHPHTPGMRVSSLIPEREALITPDYYQRKNRQVQYADQRPRGLGGLETDVRNIVDEPNWEYAAIERLNPATLAMEVIPFHLGRAVIDRDPTHDLELRPGDVVTILSRADIASPVARRTRLVRVEGEVGAPGVYQLQGGENLQALIERAGGLTGDAYIFGTDFSREETRRKQREALDDAVRRLEGQLASAAATQAANVGVGDVQAAAMRRQAQIDAQRAQLNRLRTMTPTGRIALELPTSAASLRDLPDVAMEDGDRVLVPSRPSFVFAVGAVSNTNGLLWRPGRTLQGYLDLAGVEPDADESNIFVLRADGTVIHNSRRGWLNSIQGLELMPGDNIVVPGKTDRETFWSAFVRGLKDWSQILYQFGLTAAAIETLRR